MWGVIAERGYLPTDGTVATTEGAGLRRVALDLTRDWPNGLRLPLESCEPHQTFVLTMRSSVPLAPWPTSRVTLLGDAIHAMPPSRGSGANTALRDASELCGALMAVDRGLRLGRWWYRWTDWTDRRHP
jgi:2-polyprenyl-6-methoxyphenol hydroxylase-like FAD-dependent oxidoreductase